MFLIEIYRFFYRLQYSLRKNIIFSEFRKYLKDFGIIDTLKFGTAKVVDDCTYNRWNIYQKIVRTYLRQYIPTSITQYPTDREKINDDNRIPVWVLWLQGEAAMPEIVRCCCESHRKYLSSEKYNYILLSTDNLSEYITLPQYIYEKYQAGLITKIHLSDLIRVGLLAKYGGIWMDSTLLMTSTLSEDIAQYALYSNKKIIPEKAFRDSISKGRWTGYWLCDRGSFSINFIKDTLYNYWKDHSIMIDYFLIDHVISCLYNKYDVVKREIDAIAYNNPNILNLQFMLNDTYNEDSFAELTQNTYIHKLSYKNELTKQDSENQTTYYGHICSVYNRSN